MANVVASVGGRLTFVPQLHGDVRDPGREAEGVGVLSLKAADSPADGIHADGDGTLDGNRSEAAPFSITGRTYIRRKPDAPSAANQASSP